MIPKVDLETGEILENLDDATFEGLSRLARAVKSLDKQRGHLQKPLTQCVCDECNLGREIERLTAIRDDRLSLMKKRREDVIATAERLMVAAGEDRQNFIGIGKFMKRKSTAVNCDGYEKLDREEKLRLHGQLSSAFLTPGEFVPQPDKRTLKKYLQDGSDFRINWADCFKLEDREWFDFTAE